MANHRATGKKSKRGPELVQRLRAAIISALDIVDSKGKPIDELLANEFISNPLKALELASKFCPKDLNVDLIDNRQNAAEFTDDELAEVISTGSSTRAAEQENGETQIH